MMKRIKLLRTLAGPDIIAGGHWEGEVVSVPEDVSEATARDLLKEGYATEVKE